MASTDPQAPNFEVFVGGSAVEATLVKGFTIERDVYQPDMCALVLANQNDVITTDANRMKIGAEVKIQVHGNDTPLFKGELIGVEPFYKGSEDARVTMRAVNRLHRLLRKRQSRTWTEVTDQNIFSEIAGTHGMTLEWTASEITIRYKHVYQHNQTDLEFLRMRAARIGCHFWCIDQKLYVTTPRLDRESNTPPLTLDKSAPSGAVQSFLPRLSTLNAVKKVTVRGWDPEKKQLIVGEASVTDSPLGAETADKAAEELAIEETFTVDHPIWSAEEANVLARARLRELSLSFITGTIELHGYVKEIELGKTIEIKASGSAEDPFSGKYYVMGITHRYLPSMKDQPGKKDVASQIVKLARDARKKK